jgi:hypothetical protein
VLGPLRQRLPTCQYPISDPPQRQARVPEARIPCTIFVEPGAEDPIGAGYAQEAALASMFRGVLFRFSAIFILAPRRKRAI